VTPSAAPGASASASPGSSASASPTAHAGQSVSPTSDAASPNPSGTSSGALLGLPVLLTGGLVGRRARRRRRSTGSTGSAEIRLWSS